MSAGKPSLNCVLKNVNKLQLSKTPTFIFRYFIHLFIFCLFISKVKAQVKEARLWSPHSA